MKILIVDDELISRKKLQKIIETFGQCIVVENGEDALQVATSQDPPDLILLDIIMPGIDGYEVCKRLKADRTTSDIPVIFISVNSEEDDETKGLGLGAVDYITKPFSSSIVKARVRTHLELIKYRNRLEEMVNERTVKLKKATKEMQIEIAERKQVQEALKESEEKYRTAIEHSNDGVAITKGDRHVYLNQRFAEIFGYESAEEIIGKPLSLNIHPDDLPRATDYALRRQKGESVPSRYELKGIRKDGKLVYIEVSATKTTYIGEAVALVYLRDITDRRQAEEAKRKLEAQLQQAEKMEAIGILAGGVAHDLNNILSGIVGYPQLLLLQLPKDSPLRGSILTIQKSGEKAAAVVQDLLTLARRGIVVTDVVNLNNVITDYLKSPEHKTLLSYHPGVHLKTHLPVDTLNIMGSPTHLSKTVMNLIFNAAEAMPMGGKIVVATENRYMDRLISGYDNLTEGDYVVLTISDTGTGISPDDIDKIFEPFYTKKKMGKSGTGLGMTVVWGTVKDHNGYIDVQSTEGKGTVFTLCFPATRGKNGNAETVVSLEDYMGNGEAILIVDDVEAQRQIASSMLKEIGYSVATVSSGEAAVDYLKTHKIDLLVLDMIMDPGMDGLDTYKKILERHPGQKAIIASGFSETDHVKEAQRLGAGGYIKKPFLLEKIGIAVKEELEKQAVFESRTD